MPHALDSKSTVVCVGKSKNNMQLHYMVLELVHRVAHVSQAETAIIFKQSIDMTAYSVSYFVSLKLQNIYNIPLILNLFSLCVNQNCMPVQDYENMIKISSCCTLEEIFTEYMCASLLVLQGHSIKSTFPLFPVYIYLII
jgi:hypothetical protein